MEDRDCPLMTQPNATSAPDATPRKRILIVEDDAFILDVIATTLHRSGYVVDTATTGAEAIEKFHAAPCDLLITDNRLPDLTADAIHTAITATHPTVPTILISGLVLDVSRRERFAAVLSKPFRFDELQSAVEAILSPR